MPKGLSISIHGPEETKENFAGFPKEQHDHPEVSLIDGSEKRDGNRHSSFGFLDISS